MINSLFLIVAVATPSALSFSFVSNNALHNNVHSRNIFMISDGRKPFMGGNWKMNPTTLSTATNLAADVAKLTKDNTNVEVAVFPPSCFLIPVNSQIKSSHVQLGGQDCYFETDGAFTGAISTGMLKDVGVKYVLCGHSERRTLFKDDDGSINRKLMKVLAEGLSPVLCIGETKAEYEAGKNREVCEVQLTKDLQGVTAEQMASVTIAYEPVWAIGTGLVCPASVAQTVHAFIRSVISAKYGDEVAKKIVIQYGGSVKPDNVKEIMSMPDIDGCLVGGAALNAEGFAKIVGFMNL